ncbi:MAG TPA: pitrilysin family protein [Gemmatimonadales bacterium]|nr:pitrilysin family protein [Gemmatimonadales bacterium]
MSQEPALPLLASELPPRWTEGVRRTVLPNGLTVLVQRDDSAPVVAVVTHVEAGFFDEPDRWQGISHVLEHMYFKGTPRRGVGEIARETKAAGGYLNAHTSYDHTAYFVVLPAANLAHAMDIQADALRHSEVEAGELARELQVIIQEAKRKLDSPGAVAYETLHELMFDHHRIRRWRIGYEEQLAGFTRDDVVGYYRSRYVPERTILTIVGAVDEAEALALAERLYGDWPAAEGAVDPSPAEPWTRRVRARTLRGDVAQAELVLGWRTVPPLDPAAPALDLAAAVLGAGRGSWLYRALRERGLVTSVGAHNYAPTEVGVFGVTAELEPERVAEALAGIAAAVRRLAVEGPTAEDLARARTLLLARWARQFEGMEGRAMALAAAEALDGYDFLDREYAALEAVTPDDVRAAAEAYLVADAVSGVLYLPEDRGAELTDEALRAAFATPPAGEPLAAPLIHVPATPAPAHRAAADLVAGVLHTALPGVDLLVRRKRGVPVVTVGAYVRRADFDPPAQAGLAALAARAALRGAGELDAAALAFAFERLGGSLAPSLGSDWLGFGATVLADRLGEAAALVERVVSAPRFADADIVRERGLLVSEAQQAADDMFRFPFQLAFGAAFGDRAYGLPVGGLPETLPGIAPDDVRRWHARTFGEARLTVVAVGDVDPIAATATLAGVFEHRPARAAAGDDAPVAWLPAGEPLLRVVSREKAQSALAMAFPGPARRDPMRHAADVWAAVASGLGGRLFDALRDQRSLAYTVLASTWQRARAGALVTYIATSPAREAEARDAMLEELARFAAEPVSERELAQAVSYLAGQAEVRRQSGAAVAGEILEAWLIGTGLAELEDPAAAFRAVTAEAVQEIARRHLVAAERAEGVVRGTGGGR